MPISAKPTGDYTVNTGSAYAPDHLWMLDEGSGTNAADKGTGTAMNMTLTNSAMWATDTGDTGSTMMTCNGTNKAYTGSGTLPSTAMCIVVMVKSTSATNPAGNETIFSTGNSTASTSYLQTRFLATDGYANAYYFTDDSGGSGSNSFAATDYYDAAWHMVAVKLTTNSIGISVDGANWEVDADTYQFPNKTLAAPNRFGLGCLANASLGSVFNGSILAAWVYDGTYTDWTDGWISTLYNSGDPWSTFLTTSTKYLKLLAHSSAASATGVEGWVVDADNTTYYGQFTGATFEASLESGQAVLKVAVSEFGGTALTTSDTPQVVVRNATYGTTMCDATVIEE